MLGIAPRLQSRAEAQRGLSEAGDLLHFPYYTFCNSAQARAAPSPSSPPSLGSQRAHKSSSRPNSLPAPPHTPRLAGRRVDFSRGARGVRSERIALGENPKDNPDFRHVDLESVRRTDWPDDLPEIVYLDHFGNAITGLRADFLSC